MRALCYYGSFGFASIPIRIYFSLVCRSYDEQKKMFSLALSLSKLTTKTIKEKKPGGVVRLHLHQPSGLR